MAKVNSKFIIILTGGIVVAVLGAVVAMQLVLKKPADHIKAGDKFMDEKNYAAAASSYSRAVNKDQSNVAYLTKWRDAMLQMKIEDTTRGMDSLDKLRACLRQLAETQATDVESQDAYLRFMLDRAIKLGGGNDELMRQLAAETEFFLQFHKGEATAQPGDGATPSASLASGKKSPSSLERYRGLALASVVLQSNTPKQEDVDQAVKSCLDAMSADPKDAIPVLTYARLNLYLSSRAADAQMDEDAMALQAKANDAIDKFLVENPNEPRVQVFQIERKVNATLRELVVLTDRAAKLELSQKRTDEIKFEMEKVTKDILDDSFTDLDENLLEEFRNLEDTVFPQNRFAQTLRIFEKFLKVKPGNAAVMLRRAMTLADAQNLPAAIEAVQVVRDLGPQQISVDALRLFDIRIAATMFQSIWGVKQASTITDESRKAEREQIVQEARDTLAVLRTLRDAESPQVLLAEAYMASIESRPRDASQYLDRYTEKSNGGDADSHLLRYMVEAQRGNYGEARKALIENLKRNPRNPSAIVRVAELDLQLKNYDSALELANQVLESYPQYADAQVVRDRALFFLNRSTSSDPVLQGIRDLEKFANDNVADPQIDVKVLDRATKLAEANPQSASALRALAIAQVRAGNRAAAAATIRRSLEIQDDSGARALLLELEAKDLTSAQLARIQADTNLDDLTKALASSAVLRQARRADEAKEFAKRAASLAPEDPRVIESLFVLATDAKDWEESERLVQLAVSKNVDSANGLTYRGQLLVAKGEFRQAAELLNQVVAKGGAGPEVYRMLARAHLGTQNFAEATKAFERAVEIRPNDVATIKELIFTMKAQGRGEDALKFARASEKFGAGDPIFLRQLLELEGLVGDRKVAVARRERLATSEPDDRENLMQLANLYLLDKRWPEAKTAIDRARQIRMDTDVALMEATWLWDQDKRAEAVKVFDGLEASKQGEEALRAKLVHAEFIMQRGGIDEGIKVLETARPLQDPKRLEVDQVVASVLFRQRKFEEAAKASIALIAAGVDVTNQRKRLASCYVGMEKFQEAQAELDALMKPGQEDLECLILKATAQEGLGNVEATRDYLDQGVKNNPSDPGAFRARGLFLLSLPDAAKDAKADFDSALALRENDPELLELRARSYVRMKQMDQALTDYRAALRVNPRNDVLLFGLLADLFRPSFNRPEDAMLLAQEAIASRPGDLPLVVGLGDLFNQVKRHREAASFYREALKAKKDSLVTQKLLDALLAQSPPQTQEAEGVLGQVQSEVRDNPGFLMAFAKIRVLQGRLQEADRHALEAVKLLDPNQPVRMFAWYNDIQLVQPDRAKVAEFLDKLSKMDVTPAAAQWLLFLKSDVLRQIPERREEAHASFRQLTEKAVLPVISQYAHRVLGNSYYAVRNYEEAAKVWESMLVKFPEDYEAMNNLAYTYIKFLNKPGDAEKWAFKAADAFKNSAEVQDTYGLVLIERDCKRAIAVLDRALLLVNRAQTEVTVCIHLAEASIKCGDKEGAQEAVDRADRVIAKYADPGEVDDESRAELEKVRKLIGS
jgi:tetratricopeptide (TPR) repeat protein